MNIHKRQKKFTIIIIRDERLLCSFKLPVHFFKICVAVTMGVIILSIAAALLHKQMQDSQKEDLASRIETQDRPPEVKHNAKEARSITENPDNIAIEDFRSRFDLTQNTLHYSFLIKNKDSKNATVSGYIFVILKPEGLGPEQWLSYPHTILVNGTPQNFREGDPFSITKQKAIARDISTRNSYDSISILVFSHDGKIILEKNMSLKN